MTGTESFPMASFQMWADVTTMPHVIGDFIWTAIDYIGEPKPRHRRPNSAIEQGRNIWLNDLSDTVVYHSVRSWGNIPTCVDMFL